ncbi:MAG: chemotaxis response regulator protein-glutamate methylesterase [Leptolyngbya sp. UWPOB_LEPTO1]|uniref:protein-glutamate methylesterase/protein-glutamine glutaminase n=1 Tax=Leptolyngbya sp. UWPOB_LEPTO1 TaxID=2815653 RepID=UPI001AD04251|nr:chemotaxis response regulator protein-glutamate methylesterase [Leptolyngbya sp. UWPOB_LEPTO1]MBN8563242.1 chemotaxis response regulator protein-glutamate methylesterase [Leptolyngbya sp. UWPOB_LEPTO1]
MMQKIRVLIVDDAVMVRSRLSKILATDPHIEVVGVAATGRIALAKLPQLKPDVIILDIEMPDLNGLQTLSHIRNLDPKLPVIMFSAMTLKGASITLDALALGASDYVTKPDHMLNTGDVTQYLEATLIPKIKVLSRRESTKPSIASSLPAVSTTSTRTNALAEVVAIGVSTGGPNALARILSTLPADFPVPILIVQHMPPMFTKLLAERLTAKCPLSVREATMGACLNPGTIWIAPGDYHLSVQHTRSGVQLVLDQTPPRNSCRPSVDVLFASVAETYGDRALGVVLTGMGQDGLQGCYKIRASHGQILAQDEASSVVWGMPKFVVNAGLADAVFAIDDMMPEILRRVSRASNSMRSTP